MGTAARRRRPALRMTGFLFSFLRSVKFDPDRGLLLNSQPVKVRGFW